MPLCPQKNGVCYQGEKLTTVNNYGFRDQGGWSIVRIYMNEKEVPALVKSIEGFIAVNPQSVEAQELLNRIFICIEKQCHSKTNT